MEPSFRILQREFELQMEQIRSYAEEIILYGRSVVQPVVETALSQLGISLPIRVFERGIFLDGDGMHHGKNSVVFLCGMRSSTRCSMREDASRYFGTAPCFDIFALYYHWLKDCVRRDCDKHALADTILAVREERAIHNIDSINTSFCNLNCKECSNGMQYRRNKRTVPPDVHMGSLKTLTDVMPIAYCNLQGGEPFLDRQLPERIRMHARNPGIAFLTLATNGTIIPDDEVMCALRDSGTMIRISDYGDLSFKRDELRRKAEDYGVPCDIYQCSLSWLSYGKLEAHGRSEEQNRAIAFNCHFGTKDLMLYDGRLFCCCRTLFADALGVENQAVRENVLNLQLPFETDALVKIVSGEHLHLMCDYCDFPMEQVMVAEQIPRGMV